MSNKLVIVGASGHGKVIADIAQKMNAWKIIEFLDNDSNITSCINKKVVGGDEIILSYSKDTDFFVAIGDNSIRRAKIIELEEMGYNLTTLIHPTAVLGIDITIDVGTVVMAGTVINSGSRIGKGCIINTCSSIDHDNLIGDYVHISPGSHIAGSVSIGNECWIGCGTTIINNINVHEKCIIGAGATVVKNVIETGTYIGTPAMKT